MSNRTSGMLSQMQQRRVERKKPKRFVALKKVSLDPSQQSDISNAQANLPKHPITQKHIKQSSTAFSVAMALHVLIAILIGTYVIVDRIEQEGETFDVSIVTEESKTKRRFIRREAPKFNQAQRTQQKPLLKQPIRASTTQLSKDGFTIPQGPDAALDLTTPDVSEGLTPINVDRNFVKPTTTIEPETTAQGFEIEREAPTLLDKLDTPVPNESLSVGNIDITPEQATTDPAFKIKVEPKYPESAKKAGKVGNVILQATIDEKGIPKDILALTNLGFGLEEAAIAAFKKSSFRPAMKGNTPISKQVQITYEFELDD
ncbi:energy transducer TonB [Candidatus Poribacteria bacterium]|nr:energy transducer TonB [Candidatus Poribacteria bacterium]MYG07193.1 energy transducer TonB [Candidatus Poribacteria bacterium]MYK21686.1 energy transducer TonB [Candidatus Poribacteria bacterium]